MNDKLKQEIDAMTYEEMLRIWRFAPSGDPRCAGEVGKYLSERMKIMRSQPDGQEEHVRASKALEP